MSESHSQRNIPLIMDDRECAGAIPGALRDSGQFDISITRLKTGDYLVDGSFLFERKTLPDFAASVISGRLFKQARRLAAKSQQTSFHSGLILEGVSGDLQDSGISREALQGALVTVTLFIGLPVLRSSLPEETVQLFRFVAEQGRARASGALPRRGYRPKGKEALQNHLLQSFPGIGPARAKSLLAQFGNVRSVITAGEKKLASVPGIGECTARSINWLLEESGSVYLLKNSDLSPG